MAQSYLFTAMETLTKTTRDAETGLPGTYWSASLANQPAPGSMTDTIPTKQSKEQLRKTPNVNRWPPHAHACTHVHKTYKLTSF